MNYNAFFNKVTVRRVPSVLRSLYDNLNLDDNFIIMAGGLPNPDVFPITSAVFTLSDGSTMTLDESELKRAQQYGVTAGHPKLVEFVKNMNSRLHSPPLMADMKHPGTPSIVCTAGAQDGIYKTFEVIVEEGDTVLTDEPVYAALVTVLSPLGCKIQGIQTDKDGIIPERLAEFLSNWKRPDDNNPSRDSNGGRLKALYLIPNGGNPSGARYTLERKMEIYRLAHEYNFLIVEDDAYYFLEKRPLSKSFLSLDVDGRVVRLDTFSKTVGPGFRIGTVTGPSGFIKKILQVSMASSQGSSMVSQSVLVGLLDKWGLDGFLQHCERVAEYYDERRRKCMELADKYLTGLVEYDAPTGGMFLWLKCKMLEDTMDLCTKRLVDRKVLMVAGCAFLVTENAKSQYIRVSFTLATNEQLDKGLQILGEELRALSPDVTQTNGVRQTAG